MDWTLLLTSFGLTFVAELGDKTQLAVLAQTCKHRRPWAVFLGASLALAAVTGLGVAGGRALGQLLPPSVLRIGAATSFIVMGILVGREAARLQEDGSEAVATCGCPEDQGGEFAAERNTGGAWSTFIATLGLLFVAEMGDKTQLAVLGLTGKHGQPLPVFLGGALALTAVTGLGVIGGEGLCRIVPRRVLLWVSAGAFVVMGGLMGLGVL